MMEGETSKRRRLYSFEPNTVLSVVFLHKYVNYLLPALSKISRKKRSSDVNEAIKLEKLVRFDVDLALVLSAERFGWSRALKYELERAMIGVKDIQSAPIPTLPNSISLLQSCKYNGPIIIGEKDGIAPLPLLTRPSIPNYCKGNSKRLKKSRAKISVKGDEEEQLKCRLKTLGRLFLPGGNEMGVCELLSEVESYIVCLELQVSVLQSLVDMYVVKFVFMCGFNRVAPRSRSS